MLHRVATVITRNLPLRNALHSDRCCYCVFTMLRPSQLRLASSRLRSLSFQVTRVDAAFLAASLVPLWGCHLSGAQDPIAASVTEQDRATIRAYVRQQDDVRSIEGVALSPDGSRLAWSAQDGGAHRISIVERSDHGRSIIVSAGGASACYEGEPRWSPGGAELAFLSDCITPGQLQVYVADLSRAIPGQDNPVSKHPWTPEQLTRVTGSLSHLRWSPSGAQLSFLYVRNASRVPSPMAAENRAVGLIDDRGNTDIQRVAVVSRTSPKVVEVTPPSLYAFEYDWSPDSQELAFTAAPPPGDDSWYNAQLYRQRLDSRNAAVLYHPKGQIALPRWSPDGKAIAFIEGLMSDQGGTGGEIYTVAANGQSAPLNLTPGRPTSPAWLSWRSDHTIVFTEFVGGSVAISILDPRTRQTARLWQGNESLHATGEETSVSIANSQSELTVAAVRYSWNSLPEVWAGAPKAMQPISHVNRASTLPMPQARGLAWQSDGQRVQGWLLYPRDFDPSKRYPLLVAVHGGPAWIMTPAWKNSDFNTTVFPQFGYFVLFPNPRGSYGQGEAFTIANRRDWGFGDLRDTLRGVDAVVAQLPIDPQRIGLMGWSYGGSTAMFAGTQTDRFRALVAGAGAADWLSYYGQNSIDQWMQPYFGKSPYDDPEAYARSSAMTYIKHTRTPTLVLVGEHDGEAPPPQSLQFWHALKELHVPTQLRIYADEGHSFSKQEDRIDITLRTLEWFRQYMPVSPPGATR